MSRYYFNVRNGGVLEEDFDGFHFLTDDLAYQEALQSAREIVAEVVLKGEVIHGLSFEITNEAGQVIRTLDFRSVIRFE